MSEKSDRIIEWLKQFNLSDDEANIYIYLAKNSNSTALKISKEVKLARTKVYRILDALYKKGFIDQNVGYRGYTFSVQPLTSLEKIVAEKESELHDIKRILPNLATELSQLISYSSKRSREYKVLYFEGPEGVKQVTWNSTKARGGLLLYEVDTMNTLPGVGASFAEKVREEMMRNNCHTKELTNLRKFSPFTKILPYAEKFWEAKYVDSQLLKIEVETLIYNDVVTIYHTSSKDPFCVEIHNRYLADQQRQIFNFIWSKSKRFSKSLPGGGRGL